MVGMYGALTEKRIPYLYKTNSVPACFLLFGCVISFVFMHTCFIGVEILAPQMAN